MVILSSLISLVLLLLSSTVQAGSVRSESAATVTFEIPYIIQLSIRSSSPLVDVTQVDSSTAASTFTLPIPTARDFEVGFIEIVDAVEGSVWSNTDWVLSVSTRATDMGTSHDRTYTKPLSDFLWRADGGSYQAISRTYQTVAIGRKQQAIGINYKVLFDKKRHRDGDYAITLVYTVSGV